MISGTVVQLYKLAHLYGLVWSYLRKIEYTIFENRKNIKINDMDADRCSLYLKIDL